MRSWVGVGIAGLVLVSLPGCARSIDDPDVGESAAGGAQVRERLNPMLALQEQNLPVFGVYAPRARLRAGIGSDVSAVKTPRQRADETVAYAHSDYVFVGNMEGGVDRGLPAFSDYMHAMRDVGATAAVHPLVVKMQNISEDPDAAAHIGQQLNAGVSGIVFVGVDSAEELQLGLDAMRFTSNGGTRGHDVGWAPTYWDMTDAEYRERADLWPLNPDGELVNWTIVETREGLEHVREIAAVPGVGVLFPGAGTLRRVFSTTGRDGERAVDEEAWETAIQRVLSACQEFDIACGYPANAGDIEMRMAQGFSVFVMNWGDGGFEAVEIGRAAAGR